jgi:hypothetical protein
MKAIITITANKNVLKPSLLENYDGDTVTLYRTDSVGTKRTKKKYAKPYSHKIQNNEVMVNGCNKKEFKRLFVDGEVSSLKDMFEDVDQKKYFQAYVGKTTIGYEAFEQSDVNGYSIKEEAIPVTSVDMFIITCTQDGTITVEDAVVENRNKNIDEILK